MTGYSSIKTVFLTPVPLYLLDRTSNFFVFRFLPNIVSLSSPIKGLLFFLIYRVIKKYGLNFVRLYFLKYTWYVNDLHNI